MYLPKHFQADEQQARELLAGVERADLITPMANGLHATFLPLIYDEPAGALLGHVARKNDHWRLEPAGESMAIIHGPEGYITPSWYQTKRETGKVVPTWNYLIAHVHGTLVIHDDVAWLEDLVRRLTERHEARRTQPWSIDDAPRRFTDGQLKAIVGIELKITRIETKAKLGQNRQSADVDGMIGGLRERDQGRDADLARATERSRHN